MSSKRVEDKYFIRISTSEFSTILSIIDVIITCGYSSAITIHIFVNKNESEDEIRKKLQTASIVRNFFFKIHSPWMEICKFIIIPSGMGQALRELNIGLRRRRSRT